MKRNLGIYFGLLLLFCILVVEVSTLSIDTFIVASKISWSESISSIREPLIYSTVCGFIIGYLVFGFIYSVMRRIIKSSLHRFLFSFMTGLFLWVLFLVISYFLVDRLTPMSNFIQIGSMIALPGGLIGCFVIALSFGEIFFSVRSEVNNSATDYRKPSTGR